MRACVNRAWDDAAGRLARESGWRTGRRVPAPPGRHHDFPRGSPQRGSADADGECCALVTSFKQDSARRPSRGPMTRRGTRRTGSACQVCESSAPRQDGEQRASRRLTAVEWNAARRPRLFMERTAARDIVRRRGFSRTSTSCALEDGKDSAWLRRAVRRFGVCDLAGEKPADWPGELAGHGCGRVSCRRLIAQD